MPSTTIYLGAPKAGKSTLMRSHVDFLRRQEGAPFFFIVDHDDSWNELPDLPIYNSTPQWWEHPAPCSIFRGVPGVEVAQLAIDVGWSVYVDDECDDALEDWKDNPVREIVKRGRHMKNRAGRVTAVSAMIATHRPGNLPPDVVGLFDRVYVGRLVSFNDADRVYREGWLPQVRNPIEARDILQARQPGDFSIWPE